MTVSQAILLPIGLALACTAAMRAGVELATAAEIVRTSYDAEVELRKCTFAMAAAQNLRTAAQFVRAQGAAIEEPALRISPSAPCVIEGHMLTGTVHRQVNPSLPRVWPNWHARITATPNQGVAP